jgi:signal transduction histidine kinase
MLAFSISFCLAVYFIADKIIIQNFKTLEVQSTTRNLDRAEKALEARIRQLEVFATDYAVWDDTYQFVQDQNDKYIKATLINQTFENSKINLMIILDKNGKQLFAKAYDFEKDQPLLLPQGLTDHLKPEDVLINHNNRDGVSGLLVLPNEIVLISSQSITTSDKEMPSNGTFIMGRYLDHEEQAQLKETANLDIEFVPYKNKQELSMIDNVDDFLQHKTAIKEIDQNQIVGYKIKDDIYGNPQLITKITSTRDIYKFGIQTLEYFILALAGVVVLSCIAGMIFLQKITLGPLKKVVRDVNKISSTGRFSERVAVEGQDDIALLANNINSMLSSLQKTDMSLLEANKRLNQQTEIVEQQVNERTEELHQEQSRFLAAIESISAGFLLTDIDGKILLSNIKFGEILEIKPQKFDIKIIQEHFKGYFDLTSELSTASKEKKSKTYENVSIGTKYLRVYVAPVFMGQSKDKVVGVVTVLNDVTEATMLERAKEEFFSIASHELRTPLTAIKGNTEMVKEHILNKVNNPELNQIVDDIYTACTRLIDIVNTFLTTSRLEQSRIKFNRIKFDPILLVEEVIRRLSPTIDSKKLKVTVENRSKKPIYISADRQRTEEILINLLGNAIKFTEIGQINVLVEQKDGFIEVSIEDTGKGIPEHEQNLLFKKFQQASTNIYTRDTSRGTGLGLYICKLMVEGMGGTIYLKESFVSRGSKFAFTLPSA